ncbi:TetR/AcrR family transcriptional regulator (plasmid) [Diaphorobacter sp. HDW4B]|uniref:TetR/AcrR family transcriptional regulator n=1 Tax=Diaphorobacter sp. HDW4B TaxID=2714925 RepID=UPI00140D3F87|nr:TetR/AcrR family transcriptional regulator [Diaphorobacter sp. HDW4B]QIL73826.1 TetR/AcrR family transcriptional regulator [Diaphorobacter sp. HDW4B]
MDKEAAILDGALALLEAHGPAGLTTRAVCEAAGIKAPTLYHYFGDKDGLERAVIRRGLADFMRLKQQTKPLADPLEQLRDGWDVALEFALKRPALYALVSQHARTEPELLADAYALMQSRVQRLVDMGRLQGPVDHAARGIWAASQGALSLLFLGTSRKDVEAVSDLLFNAVIDRLSKAHP